MLQLDPGEEKGAKGEVKEAFPGDGKDDKYWRKSEKDDDEAVEIVVVRTKPVKERYCQGRN